MDETALVQNQACLSAEYNPNLPIELLWNNVAECVIFADDGRSKITDQQILDAAVAAVTASGVFLDEIKDWKKTPFVDRTYTNFRPFMNKAHHSWRRHLTVTVGVHYHHTNTMLSFYPPTNKMIAHEIFPTDIPSPSPI